MRNVARVACDGSLMDNMVPSLRTACQGLGGEMSVQDGRVHIQRPGWTGRPAQGMGDQDDAPKCRTGAVPPR